MFFTQEDYKKILTWLNQNAIKDSEFKEASLPLNEYDIISFVLNGNNVKVRLKDFLELLFLLREFSDFINVTDKYKAKYILLKQAILLVPYKTRKIGQVITFLNEEKEWKIYQFKGESVNQWNEESLWEDIAKAIQGSDLVADEEDLTEVVDEVSGKSLLKLKDKAYDPDNFSGLGRVILRKNIVTILNPDTLEGQDINLLTLLMINKPNTIYEIQYDFDLNNLEITIPEGCVLDFKGGSLSNGVIKGNNTVLKTLLTKIFSNIPTGTWALDNIYPEWFGALLNGKTDSSDAILKAILFSSIINKPIQFGFNYLVTKTLKMSWGGETLIGTRNLLYCTIIKDFDGDLFLNNSNYVNYNLLLSCISVDCKNHTGSVINGGKESSNNRISPIFLHRCRFINCNDIAINIKDCYWGTISECIIEEAKIGIYMKRTNAMKLEKCSLYNCRDICIKIDGECYSNIIDNCTFQGSKIGIYSNSNYGLTISGIYVEWVGSIDTSIINIIGCIGVLILGCNFSSNYTTLYNYAKHVIFISKSQNVNISANRYHKNICLPNSPIIKNNDGEFIRILDDASIESTSGFITNVNNIVYHKPDWWKGKIRGDRFFKIDNPTESSLVNSEYIWNGERWKKQGFLIGYNAVNSSSFSTLSVPNPDNFTEVYLGFRLWVNDLKKSAFWNEEKININSLYTKKGTETFINNTLLEGVKYFINPISDYNTTIAFAKTNDIKTAELIIIGTTTYNNILTVVGLSLSLYPYLYVKEESLNNNALKIDISKDNSNWVEEGGIKIGTLRSGKFSEKPTKISNNIPVGFAYFCTDKQTIEGATSGIMIYYKGDNVWVDALGRVIS